MKRPLIVAIIIACTVTLLVTETVAASVADNQGTILYRVRRGDTLSAIATRYGTTVTAIMRANHLSSTLIQVGQTLLIPLTTSSGSRYSVTPVPDYRPDSSATGVHIVRAGETLFSIASRYGVTVAQLKAYNGLLRDTIWPGQRLRIPNRGTSIRTAPAVSAREVDSRLRCASRYRVRPGDTLSGIARRYGVTVADLMSYNGLRSPAIYAGKLLCISLHKVHVPIAPLSSGSRANHSKEPTATSTPYPLYDIWQDR